MTRRSGQRHSASCRLNQAVTADNAAARARSGGSRPEKMVSLCGRGCAGLTPANLIVRLPPPATRNTIRRQKGTASWGLGVPAPRRCSRGCCHPGKERLSKCCPPWVQVPLLLALFLGEGGKSTKDPKLQHFCIPQIPALQAAMPQHISGPTWVVFQAKTPPACLHGEALG